MIPRSIMLDYHFKDIHYWQALRIEFFWIATFIGAVVVVGGVAYGAYKAIPFLANTPFGRFINESSCPRVKVCPVDQDCGSVPATS